jgi:hypothetical protein
MPLVHRLVQVARISLLTPAAACAVCFLAGKNLQDHFKMLRQCAPLHVLLGETFRAIAHLLLGVADVHKQVSTAAAEDTTGSMTTTPNFTQAVAPAVP